MYDDAAEKIKMKNFLRQALPQLQRVGGMYADAYPPDTTDPKVLDAVTVPVPLRVFAVLVAWATDELSNDSQAPQKENDNA